MPPNSDPPEQALRYLAELAGHGAGDTAFWARVADGAAAAAAALRPYAHDSLMAHEPADYAGCLDACAPAAATCAPARPQAVPAIAAARRVAAALPLEQWSLIDVAAHIASGELRSVDVTAAALARAKLEQPRLNCFIELVGDQAMRAAEAADRRRASGQPLGALHGVPLAHKDMFDLPGRAPTCGARLRGPAPARAATVIERLDAAGAISIGMLNMSEFAIGATGDNVHYGRCRNAVEPAFMAGGSSSGSAAAVAGYCAFGALGSDTGGSVRIPAAANGVVGLKPTYGRISRAGSMRLSPSVDTIGPLARRVADVALLLDVVAGPDERDSTASNRPAADTLRGLPGGVTGLRIGVVSGGFLDGMTAEVGTLMQRSHAALRAAGATLVEVELPDSAALSELSRALIYPQISALHGAWLREYPQLYSPAVRVRASSGVMLPASVYAEALTLRPRLLQRFVAQVFSRCDVLHLPTLMVPVPRFADVDTGGGTTLWSVLAQLVHCTAPFNYLGLPALSLPAGRTANGLPASVQLVGRPFDESTLLRVGAVHETACDATSNR